MSTPSTVPLASTSTLPSSAPNPTAGSSGTSSQPLGTSTSGEGSHTNPTTPVDILTPHLSHHPSPDTPGVQLQTPYNKSKQSAPGPTILLEGEEGAVEAGRSMGEGGELGLGYDVDIKGKGRLGRSEEIEAGQSTPPVESADQAQDQSLDRSFPDTEALKNMMARLKRLKEEVSGNAGSRDELIRMVESLLVPTTEQLPFLQGQIVAQRETIRTLQEQAKLSAQLARIEKDRQTAERQAWRTEMQAVLTARDNEIAAGTRPRKVLDLDVGYHQELEAANKRLEMDNRLMAPRLADTQRQIDKLVTELRHLRSHVVLSSVPLSPNLVKREAGEPRRIIDTSKTAASTTTMGDARTEHLLLAARKVRSMRAENSRVGRLTLEELKRGGVVGPDGGIGYSEGYGGLVEAESEEEEASDEEDPIFIASGTGPKGKGKVQHTPLLPRPKKPLKKVPPSTPKSNRPSATAETTTPGGSNFSDLLRAAEMATRPGTPTPEAPGRDTQVRTSANRPAPEQPAASTTKRRRESRPDDPVFALDLLAQASQLDVAQGDSADEEPSSSSQRLGGVVKRESSPPSSESGALAPAIDLRHAGARKSSVDESIDPSLLDSSYQPPILPQLPPAPPVATPTRNRKQSIGEVVTPRMPQREYYDYDESAHSVALNSPPAISKPLVGLMANEDMSPGAFASPTGATVPGLGKYVHLTSNMPARRVRSPYLKWTVEEDELLARAVAIHGEKWDLVSKGVPTRSYHQVRQRWLRKTGAFDKKPMGGVGGDMMGDEDKETSPTPRTPAAKRRKV